MKFSRASYIRNLITCVRQLSPMYFRNLLDCLVSVVFSFQQVSGCLKSCMRTRSVKVRLLPVV